MTTKTTKTKIEPDMTVPPRDRDDFYGIVFTVALLLVVAGSVYFAYFDSPSTDETYNYVCSDEQLVDVEKRLNLCAGSTKVEDHGTFRTWNVTPWGSRDTTECYKDAVLSSCTFSPVNR